ncbi:MAG: hypothetical protein JW807_02865 [Spirochaetes bacterium]|nr:hypothetical protein [Spirochaetota bacterium]
MKVSIEGILGTARKINNQKEQEESNLSRKKGDVKADSVSIGSRINSRLDTMETEFREVQSSLTRNQIIRDGIEQLRTDLMKGGAAQQQILDGVTFEGATVLRAFVGDEISDSTITAKIEENTRLINSDITHLKKLQVELDNITASDLAGQDRAVKINSNIDSIFASSDMKNIEAISTIRPDAVMRLIK